MKSTGASSERSDRGSAFLLALKRATPPSTRKSLARKAAELRIFPDGAGKMNLSLADVGGRGAGRLPVHSCRVARKGRRPSFDDAEAPGRAAELFDHFVLVLRTAGFIVATGVFQASMDVHILNDGPVTFILESKKGDLKEFQLDDLFERPRGRRPDVAVLVFRQAHEERAGFRPADPRPGPWAAASAARPRSGRSMTPGWPHDSRPALLCAQRCAGWRS